MKGLGEDFKDQRLLLRELLIPLGFKIRASAVLFCERLDVVSLSKYIYWIKALLV